MTQSSREFPYHTETYKTNHWEASEWCEEQFGTRWNPIDNRNGTWSTFWKGRSIPGSYDWYFLYERDYLLFLLKYGK